MEDEEESITGVKNVTAYAFIHASISQVENADAIFTRENLDKLDELVNEINNLTINDAGYELNKATASDSQVGITSNPDTVAHTSSGTDTVTYTSNEVQDDTLLSCGTIRRVSALPPPENPILLAPQMLMTPDMNKIFADVKSVNTCTNQKSQQLSRAGVNSTTPGSIFHTCGISETSYPDLIEIIEVTAPACGINITQQIGGM